MKYNPERHHRRSIRLLGYDYRRAGTYFVTLVTHQRECLFGHVADGDMRLNDAGEMVLAEWEALPGRFTTVETDAFVVMPNHLHGIIVITANDIVGAVGAGLVPAPGVPSRVTTGSGATTRVAPTVGDIVGAFKSLTTVLYIHGVKQSGWPPFRQRLWQRNYYEHIIRDDLSLQRIRAYIDANPVQWSTDRENPDAVIQKKN